MRDRRTVACATDAQWPADGLQPTPVPTRAERYVPCGYWESQLRSAPRSIVRTRPNPDRTGPNLFGPTPLIALHSHHCTDMYSLTVDPPLGQDLEVTPLHPLLSFEPLKCAWARTPHDCCWLSACEGETSQSAPCPRMLHVAVSGARAYACAAAAVRVRERCWLAGSSARDTAPQESAPHAT